MNSKKKKILFVSNEYSVGGSSVSLKSLIIGLRRNLGDEIEIIVMLPWNIRRKKAAKVFFETAGIQCKEMLYRNNYKRCNQKKTVLHCIKGVLNRLSVLPVGIYMKWKGFDWVCSNSSAVDVGAEAAMTVGIPHAYYVREFMDETQGIEYCDVEKMQRLLEKSDIVLFVSKALEEWYKKKYRLNKTVQFYDGFVLEDYYVKNHVVMNENVIRLIQVGRLEEAKGVSDSIEIMKMLKDEGIHCFQLEFVGAGSMQYENQMREKIRQYHLEQQILISPFVSNIKEKLALADVLLMNSFSEGFGRVTVEGMLAGCLAVGRTNAGTLEIIEHEKNGMLYTTSAEAVNILRDIANNRTKYIELADYGQRWALEEFDCTKTAKKFCHQLHISK